MAKKKGSKKKDGKKKKAGSTPKVDKNLEYQNAMLIDYKILMRS